MAMQFYASPEQIMRDRSELARKGIARGRSAVVLSYAGGVLFVAENLSSTLHKVGEIYDRIGFAAVGRYNEFENLRRAGVRMADLNGLSYDRRDVTGLALANTFAQILGTIFTEQSKPFEVEICVAEVGTTSDDDSLYRLTYDGSVTDEPGRMAMGGQADAISGVLKSNHRPDMSLGEAVKVAVQALGSVGGEGGAARTIAADQLEVAVLDRNRVGRTFRRITGAALTGLLDGGAAGEAAAEGDRAEPPTTPTEEAHKPTTSAGSADLEDKPGDKPDA
ncbi:proteasome subunit alpha [Micromonospora craniellae]|uniref:Proteasome subunit alpha n=1 Tax=Micromonospora craniellae TaxID=2294034 RepID=A0A372G1J3_9ACTN|nr:proteasome subunit alpha [Micromonospora craniellae]QOC91630.1 proteasome subunit alpha [Micromonospora craniellae]RFS46590.1 proteasome subunit alpha [Micromonospora craniellae]